jgi:hypothetical protein
MLMAKVPQMPVIRVDEAAFREYVSAYSPEKAARLLEAIAQDRLHYDGDTTHVFAKQEVLLKDHGTQPRVIHQSTDMHNALAGVICTELSRRMKQVFSRTNPLNVGNVMLYACGMSNEEIGDVIEASPGGVVENDMKNNDGSQSVHFRRYEAMMYRKLGAPDWFVREFAKNTSVNVWTRYGVAATIVGQLWSGRNNTTTGNSYVGMCLMLHCLTEAGIEKSTNIHGGDDYLGIVEEGKESALQASIEKFVPAVGMTPEVVLPKTREHATFYRKRYVRTLQRTRGVPQFGRVLAKLNLRANRNAQVGDREYMAGKYLSAAYEHRYVPRLASYLREVSAQMSDKPHFDLNTNREVGKLSVEQVNAKIDAVEPLSEDDVSGFLNEVYGCSLDELFTCYAQVADSCVDYLNGWTSVDRKGKPVVKPGYTAHYLRSTVAESLVRVDLGY